MSVKIINFENEILTVIENNIEDLKVDKGVINVMNSLLSVIGEKIYSTAVSLSKKKNGSGKIILVGPDSVSKAIHSVFAGIDTIKIDALDSSESDGEYTSDFFESRKNSSIEFESESLGFFSNVFFQVIFETLAIFNKRGKNEASYYDLVFVNEDHPFLFKKFGIVLCGVPHPKLGILD